jgi:hypothetical protein
MATPSRGNRVFRVSLAGLLFITLCACGFFAGYRRGYQNGGRDRRDTVYLVSYPVGDLTAPPANAVAAAPIAPEKLIALLEAEVAPESWMSNGNGEGELQYFAKNSSLIVSQTERGHAQTSLALSILRRLRLPPNSLQATEQAESLADAGPSPPASR